MARREISPPDLPDVAFTDLSAEAQARCVGWNLRLARKGAGLTMPAFVARMRSTAASEAVSLSYMGDIERGARNPSLTTVLALARALEIDPRALFRLPEQPSPAAASCHLEEADAA